MNDSLAKGISIIIPAFNEAGNISETLASIECGKMPLPYEVIVVDHDSTDSTAATALRHGATVVHKKGGTVASVRNSGVEKSSGDILVFLDADVSLTRDWFKYIGSVVRQIEKSNSTVTGSFCSTQGGNSLLEKYWFDNLLNKHDVNYLGSAHMIVSRKLFLEVGGFDEALSTGEDYAFCAAVMRRGGRIVADPYLRVVHRDFPKSISEFIRREAWHGTGDVVPIKKMLRSKVALATLVFFVSHVVAVVSIFAFANSAPYIAISIGVVAALLIASSYTKFRFHGLRIVLVNAVIFYFYYIGRSLSFLRLFGVDIRGHKR